MSVCLTDYYISKPEPLQSCLLALRHFILHHHPNISESYKFGTAFFTYDDKMLCYLGHHKKLNQPYIGFIQGSKIDHPALLQEKRKMVKIVIIDCAEDLPVNDLEEILNLCITCLTTGGNSVKMR
jgi:hypothetical protein